MLATRFTEAVHLLHPIALGGMGVGTSPQLAAAVCQAGGLGVLGATHIPAGRIGASVSEIREATDRPFGLNFLLAFAGEEALAAGFAARPSVLSFAWPRPDQRINEYFARAHEAGALVMHMVSTAGDAVRAAEAGADILVAQGTEGGGHVGQMGTVVLVRQCAKAVPERPLLAAGGIADGAGLAAALALGADGVLLGTRFLATVEAPIHENYKQAILASDGTDSVLTDIPDIAQGRVWPGAMDRVLRTRLIEEFIGREWLVRQQRPQIAARLARAREVGDVADGSLGTGQVAGLIDSIEPAGELVARIAREAEATLARLGGIVAGPVR
ncbi:MAG TPA: nitronate monooxygenase family protein [Chloroflexota bacterium]|nr:nitronate monooxygenase family protein [Chloroflexota bacterium]